jgi:hypothetical protein
MPTHFSEKLYRCIDNISTPRDAEAQAHEWGLRRLAQRLKAEVGKMNAPTQLYRRKHSSRHTKKSSIFDVMATRHVQISQVLAGIKKEP